MKNKRIDLRASQANEMELIKASAKLGTETVSSTIFESVKKAAEKIEYGADRQAIRDTVANVDYCRSALQALVNELKELTGIILSRDELEQACKGMGKLGSTALLENAFRDLVMKKLYEKLAGSNPDLVVTADNIRMPDLSRLFELSDLLDSAPGIKGSYCGCHWSAYEISDKGEVLIIEKEVERLTDNYRFKAESPDEIKKLAVVQAICDALNNALSDPAVSPANVYSLVFYDNESKMFSPTGALIKVNHLQPKFERKTF